MALTSILGSISAALSSPLHVPLDFSPYQLVHEVVSTSCDIYSIGFTE